MNRMSWLLVVPLSIVSVLSLPMGCIEFDSYSYKNPTGSSSSSGSGGAGGGSGGQGGMGASTTGTGGMAACSSNDPCIMQENECRSNGLCSAGTCEWTLEQAGTDVSDPAYGDCKSEQCDAAGSVVTGDKMADVYDWGNPCYKDGCSAWTKSEGELQNIGAACTTAWGKAGTCAQGFECVECIGSCSAGLSCSPIGKCIPGHCSSGTMDGDETDVDCGGSCDPCPVDKKCSQRSDCVGEGKCAVNGGAGKVCYAPACDDTFVNGDETDEDCGGTCAKDPINKPCAAGKKCLFPSDCDAGLSCVAGTCTSF